MSGKNFLPFVILLILVLSACQPPARQDSLPETPAATEYSGIQTASAAAENPPAQTASAETPAPVQPQVRVSEIVNQVQVRRSADDNPVPVQEDALLPLLGYLQSGEQSSARLDVLPDATIIRIGPNSTLRLDELAPQDHGVLTRVQLFFGQLWIVLNGGQLDVQTPNGLASVRGSYMSVSFDDQSQRLQVTCLEGHCHVENESGSLDLTNGQKAAWSAGEQLPAQPQPMTAADYGDWRHHVPEAENLIPDILPTQAAPQSTIHLLNTCQDVWVWAFSGSKDWTIEVQPNAEVSQILPPGDFNVRRWWQNDPSLTETIFIPAGSDYYSTSSCSTELIPITPTAIQIPQQGQYTLINQCNEVWHWLFQGSSNFSVDVAAYATANGTLSGDYTATSWFDSNPGVTNDYIIPANTHFIQTGCP